MHLKFDRTAARNARGGYRAEKVLSLCGVVMPLWLAAVVTIASSLRPGYDQLSQTISELGVGSLGAVMDVGFFVTGLLVVAAALGLRRSVSPGRAARAGFILLIVYAAGNIVDSLFTCDLGCPLTGSFHQEVHNVTAIVAFVALEFSPLLFSRAFRADSAWRSLVSFSILSGIGGIAGLLSFLVAEYSFPGLVGITQRLLIGVPAVWIGAVSTHSFRVQSLHRQGPNSRS